MNALTIFAFVLFVSLDIAVGYLLWWCIDTLW